MCPEAHLVQQGTNDLDHALYSMIPTAGLGTL